MSIVCITCYVVYSYMPLRAQEPTQEPATDQAESQETASAINTEEQQNKLRSYPLIRQFQQSTTNLKQFITEVRENKRRLNSPDILQPLLPLSFYTYPIQKQDTLFSISKKSGITYDAIATLNRLEHPYNLPAAQQLLLLPNQSGLFIPTQPDQTMKTETEPLLQLSEWEKQLYAGRDKQRLFQQVYVGEQKFVFYSSETFNVAEKEVFLQNIFHTPVKDKLTIISNFGYRIDPITGKRSFHDGLDIRSPYGATIYSIANASVLEIGQNNLYGLYIKLRLNTEKLEIVLYAHLLAVLVEEGQLVKAGEAVASSGRSGRSTGPHLHLSFFKNTKAVDPKQLLKQIY